MPPTTPTRLAIHRLSFACPNDTGPVFQSLSFSTGPNALVNIAKPITYNGSALNRTFLYRGPRNNRVFFNAGRLNGNRATPSNVINCYNRSTRLFTTAIRRGVHLNLPNSVNAILGVIYVSRSYTAFPTKARAPVNRNNRHLSNNRRTHVTLTQALFRPQPLLVLSSPFTTISVTARRVVFSGLHQLNDSHVVLLLSRHLSLFPGLSRIV